MFYHWSNFLIYNLTSPSHTKLWQLFLLSLQSFDFSFFLSQFLYAFVPPVLQKTHLRCGFFQKSVPVYTCTFSFRRRNSHKSKQEKFMCPFITIRVIKYRSNGEPRKPLSRRAEGRKDSLFSWLIIDTPWDGPFGVEILRFCGPLTCDYFRIHHAYQVATSGKQQVIINHKLECFRH